MNVDQPIFASAPGTVVKVVSTVNAQWAGGGYGNYTIIRHADNTCTRYAHMKYGTVQNYAPNQIVDRGAYLGNVGNTGNTEPIGRGQHLHFAREDCSTGKSMPVSFVETGGGLANGSSYVSHNDPCAQDCNIRSMINGKLVAAEISRTGDGWGELRARKDGPAGSWETFRIEGDCRSAAGCAFKSVANDRYVSVEVSRTGDGYAQLRARQTGIGGWERFQLVGDCRSATGCAIKSLQNGCYTSAEIGWTGDRYGTLRARQCGGIGGWERFQIG
ncbi:MAG: M23 family metallopeptidase [Acidimicrobiales bacterium]|nr:M23 family metallopeptidase [Acidimicrobiales bacterium]